MSQTPLITKHVAIRKNVPDAILPSCLEIEVRTQSGPHFLAITESAASELAGAIQKFLKDHGSR